MRKTLLRLAFGGLTLCGLALAVDITVDASKKFQTIEGFGTCLISWESRMTAYYRTAAAQ